ncbi:hypothetical protein IWW36_000078 [Coemansia brasiliensis]|uniref:RRM Nup35-type domain-containing protein n=1 Tax=Coemansia brasiliensis TaxID=2650707 RepID=A0A9W8IBK7_9FUNG|nr:hypothetical protein IWW36_000078 [Coemansia brasiliensis]
MSFLSTQPVGERVRFQSQFPMSGQRDSGDLLTPTRQIGSISSPFRTSLRRGELLESNMLSNPFTPRVDRGLSPAGSRMLPRRSLTLGTNNRPNRSSNLYQTETPAPSIVQSSSVQGAPSPYVSVAAEYPNLGGIGGWPTENTTTSVPLSSNGELSESNQGSKSPFSRPKSPAPRSASPHRNSKKLPSFLLGSLQSGKSAGTSTPYPPDTALSANSTAAVTIYSIPSAHPSGPSPVSSRPVSPRFSRRLSGFGSNDMLSSAYRASGTTSGTSRAGASASSLDDAPPIMTLEDMSIEDHSGLSRANDTAMLGTAEADVFAMDSNTRAQFNERQQTKVGEKDSNEQDYNDVAIRAVVVSGLPPKTESSTLNYFRSFGEILAFSMVPTATDSLALLFSEPWQAQQAVAQGDSNGRIILDNRIVARVDWADASCVSMLFKQVFPNCPLPSSAAPAASSESSLSQTIYAQSPRKRPASSVPTHGRSRVAEIVESESRTMAGPGSPFRQNKQVLPSGTLQPSSTMMAATSGQASTSNTTALPKPRNGVLQSVLDILFGW